MPPLSQLVATLDAYWYVIAAIAVFLLACWRALPVATRDAIERQFPRLVGAVRVLYAILPDLIGAGRAFRVQILEGTAKRDAITRDPPRRQGYFRFPLLTLTGLLSMALTAALWGCPLPPPDGCTPMATRCSPQGKPQRCSASQRWWSEPTAQSCASVGAVCCLARSPYGNRVHACVPQAVCIDEPTLADAIADVDAVESGAR